MAFLNIDSFFFHSTLGVIFFKFFFLVFFVFVFCVFFFCAHAFVVPPPGKARVEHYQHTVPGQCGNLAGTCC